MSREDDIEFQKVFMEGLVPRLEGSAFAVSICPTSEDRLDAKFCTELGAMIMLNKPILAVLAPGQEVPGKLAAVADRIIHVDLTSPEGPDLISHEIGAWMDGQESQDGWEAIFTVSASRDPGQRGTVYRLSYPPDDMEIELGEADQRYHDLALIIDSCYGDLDLREVRS